MTHDRVLLNVALSTATDIVGALRDAAGQVEYAGSLRRWRETIGDVDILATAGDDAHAERIMAAFREMSDEIVVSGPTKTSIRADNGSGLQVDLRVVRPECYGAALQYFTGSQAHNVAVRQVAIRAGLKLSEYGLFRGDELIASATEDDVYAALGMDWVPPPMREDTGEVEAGIKRQIPALVQEKEIRGDLHTHTNLTDGVASLEEMIRQAEPKGYAYYAVTDHAPNLIMQRMTDEKMLAQRARLATLTSSMVLLHGTELNIAPDGSVDWDEDFLSGFDMCVASVHSHFDQDRRGDDEAVHRGVREPAREHHRPPAHPQDRPPPAGRRGPWRAVHGVRPDRHRARGERLAGRGSTCRATTSGRPGTRA